MPRVDVRDEICPRPALIVRQELSELEPGDTLVVHGDYPPAERNLRRMCDKHGFDVSTGDIDVTDDEFVLRIEITDAASIPGG